MSAQISPHQPDSLQLNSSTQEVKQRCYQILQSNHQILWQNFTLCVLNHVSYVYRAQRMSAQKVELWVKQEIQSILKWISNPKNRALQQNYKLLEKRWAKQRKQWEATFQKQLMHETEIKQKYKSMLEQVDRKYKKLEAEKENAEAKKSVLQSLIKSYQLTFNWNPSYQIHTADNLGISNQMIITVDGAKCEVNGETMKEDRATMTAQILPSLDINEDYQPKLTHMQTKQTQTLQNNQALPRSFLISRNLQEGFHGQQKNANSIQIQTQIDSKLFIENNVVKIQIEGQNESEKEKEIVSKRQTNTTECEHEILDQSSSSSSSSYILECDRGTQTLIPCLNNSSCQTELFPQKVQKSNQPMFASFLLKLSQLQADIEIKNQQILEKNNYISQVENKIQKDHREILQLKQQIRIASQIEVHMSQKYEQGKEKYKQMQEKYQEVLSILSNYIQEDSRHVSVQQSTQTEQAQVKTKSQLKSESQDDQPLTTESEELDHFNPISMVDKSTIVRYLLEFMKIEIEGGNIEKKAAILVTLLSVLELKIEETPLFHGYMAKVNYFSKIPTNQNTSQGIQHKLFKYLTDQN